MSGGRGALSAERSWGLEALNQAHQQAADVVGDVFRWGERCIVEVAESADRFEVRFEFTRGATGNRQMVDVVAAVHPTGAFRDVRRYGDRGPPELVGQGVPLRRRQQIGNAVGVYE